MSEEKPWKEVGCCKACFFAKHDKCKCRCHGAGHGKGRKAIEKKLDDPAFNGQLVAPMEAV